MHAALKFWHVCVPLFAEHMRVSLNVEASGLLGYDAMTIGEQLHFREACCSHLQCQSNFGSLFLYYIDITEHSFISQRPFHNLQSLCMPQTNP